MLASQRVAIAAHLHVLLRRKTGRVTDTEWMAQNQEYAAEIVRYCRAKAQEDGHAELAEWAGKLEAALASATPAPRPLAAAALERLRERHAQHPVAGRRAATTRPEDAGFGDFLLEDEPVPAPVADHQRYVGGIR